MIEIMSDRVQNSGPYSFEEKKKKKKRYRCIYVAVYRNPHIFIVIYIYIYVYIYIIYIYIWPFAKKRCTRSGVKVATTTVARRCANTGRVGIMCLALRLEILGSAVLILFGSGMGTLGRVKIPCVQPGALRCGGQMLAPGFHKPHDKQIIDFL